MRYFDYYLSIIKTFENTKTHLSNFPSHLFIYTLFSFSQSKQKDADFISSFDWLYLIYVLQH